MPLTEDLIDKRLNEHEMLPVFNRLFGGADGYTFILMGDCPLEDLKPYIEKYLGGLPHGKVHTEYCFSRRPLKAGNDSLVSYTGDSPKASVTLIYQRDLPVDDFRSFTLKSNVMAAVLRSRLLKSLREEMGKVYSVSVSSSAGKYPSFLSRTAIGFVCAPQDVDTLLATIRQELETLLQRHPDAYADILKDVKHNLLKEYALNRQRNSFWTSQIRNAVFNREEDWEGIRSYPQEVERLTMAELSAFARQLLQKASLTKAILYPRKGLKE